MSFAAEFHVPGAYRFPEPTSRNGATLSAGIFRPPVSPSDSTYNLTKSTGSVFSDISMSNTGVVGTAKRKRVSTRESTPVDWSMNMDGANDDREEERPSAIRQTRYTLAGQINATPAGVPNGAENGILEDSVYSDVDYRRALGPQKEEEAESPSIQLGASGFNPKPANAPGWSTLALHTIGDVVGKVWEFCKTGSFRGFHAGGGKGYDMQTSTPSQAGKLWCNEHDVPTLPNDDIQPNKAPAPAPALQPEFTPFSPEYHETSTPETTPRPAAKRRQVSGHDELKKNWVLVDEPSDQKPQTFSSALSKANSRPSTARARQSGYYTKTAASSGRRISVPVSRLGGGTQASLPRGRASLRISHAGSPNLTTREPASFAAPRSPVTRGTPSRIPVPVPTQPPNPFAFNGTGVATLSPAGRPASRQSRVQSPIPSASPTKTHRHRQSVASVAPTTRRRTGTGIDIDDIQASPRLDAEAKQLAQKKLAAERDTDARVDAFNARLLSMIRQGKEALGTKVEVMDDGGVEGWEDDY